MRQIATHTQSTQEIRLMDPIQEKVNSIWSLRFARLKKDKAAIVGAFVLLFLVLLSYLSPLLTFLTGLDGSTTDLLKRFDAPSHEHWLGNDEAGRDVFFRLLEGGKTSLSIGILGALGCTLIGTLIGASAGYFRGQVDMILMRFTDFMISLPSLPLLIILAAIDLSKLGVPQSFINSGAAGYWRIIIIVTLLGWTGVARLVRASTLSLVEREFVLSARAQGASSFWILWKHILPNAISPVIVATTLAMGRIMLTESGLSFLGVGIQPPLTSWGSMLTNAQEMMVSNPELAIYPGAMIFLTVIAINFLGDGLQSAFDPRSDPR
jgi:peptide/nickel transport system permease protein